MNAMIRNEAFNNMLGPLQADIHDRLRAVLQNPRGHWDDAHGIILRADVRMGLTLWQAVMAVDPTFPNTGKVTNQAGDVIEDWPRYPDQVLIGRALRYAAELPRKVTA